MITRFHVERFRSLCDLTLELKPLNVLVGRNDAGKSNVLRALRTLSRLANEGTTNIWPKNADFTRDRWQGPTGSALGFEVHGRTATSDLSYSVEIAPAAGAPYPSILREAVLGHLAGSACRYDWTFQNGGTLVVADAEPSRDRGHGPTQFALPAERNENPLPDALMGLANGIATLVGGWGHLFLRPEAMRVKSPPVAGGPPQIAGHGRGLPVIIDHLYREDRARFQRIETALRSFAPGIAEIIPREEVGEEEVFRPVDDQNGASSAGTVHMVTVTRQAVYKKLAFRLTAPDCVVDAPGVSDGIMLALGWIVATHVAGRGSLIAVEEPENSIHPAAIGTVMDFLHRLSQGQIEGMAPCQVVIATHSPFVLDCLRLDGSDELFVLQRDADGATHAHAVSTRPWLRQLVPPYLLGEAWVNFGDEGLAGDTLPPEPGTAPSPTPTSSGEEGGT